ncbi:asparagine synthetase, partial [Rhizopus stolonifer]
SGFQPFTSQDDNLILVVNGEIYNHDKLRHLLKEKYAFKTESDGEVILPCYREMGKDLVQCLDGMFSFVLLDKQLNRVIAARDPIGITTLYYGWNSKMPGTVYFASELKSLNEDCDKILAFPPGHIYDSDTNETQRYYQPSWISKVPTTSIDYRLLRESLEQAVHKRLMAEVPYGVLLSGGLDSSLIASIAVRETEKVACGQKQDPKNHAFFANTQNALIHSFSIGLEGSPDLVAARKVAKFLKTYHHEYTFTIQEALDAIQDVIFHLETYDVTTIRASTPMYLLSRKIKAFGVKMVLSGEGADEILGGYLYFDCAPNKEEFHRETVDRVMKLHTADCLRANKSTMAWGLEARVPFLDKTFLEVAMNIDPEAKLHDRPRGLMEKYVLRKAFDDPERPYLPRDILWRQKEQFSDGVGYSWIDSLKEASDHRVSNEMFQGAAMRWKRDVPTTKEAYMYREIFDHWFPQEACSASVIRWIPRADWGCPEDPSGRAQKVHDSAYMNGTA